MKRRIIIMILLTLLLAGLAANTAYAMSSPGYRLDWFTPLTTNGGGASVSTNYAVNITVGQTVRGPAESASYSTGLGYWYGIFLNYLLHLPIVIR